MRLDLWRPWWRLFCRLVRHGSPCLPGEGISLEEGVDEGEQLLLLLGRQLLDAPQALQESLICGLDGFGRSQSQELIGGDAEELDECGEQVGGRVLGLGLVVGDHALGDAELACEIALREASGFSQPGHSLPEGLLGGVLFELRFDGHGRVPEAVSFEEEPTPGILVRCHGGMVLSQFTFQFVTSQFMVHGS
jgi:hypothetical protein